MIKEKKKEKRNAMCGTTDKKQTDVGECFFLIVKISNRLRSVSRELVKHTMVPSRDTTLHNH